MSATVAARADDLRHRCATAVTLWDALRLRRMIGGERARLGAVVENVIAAIQARVEPSEWGRAGASTAEAIERRCASPSAVASVLLRLRPEIANIARGFRPEHLGTDAVGRGAGWGKTANTVELAKGCADAMQLNEMPSGALFRALKDIIVAGVHGGMMGHEKPVAGAAIARLIERRMVVR